MSAWLPNYELDTRCGPRMLYTACILHGSKVFITNDRRLAKLSPLVQILFLDDYAPTNIEGTK